MKVTKLGMTIVEIRDLLADPSRFDDQLIGITGYTHSEAKLVALYGTDDENNRSDNTICVDPMPGTSAIPIPVLPAGLPADLSRSMTVVGIFLELRREAQVDCVGHLRLDGESLRILRMH